MFGTDVIVAELARFFEGQLQDPFGPGREGNFHGHKAGAAANDLFNLDPSILEVDPHRLQHLGGHPGALADQAQQDLLSADEVVAKAAGLLLGQHDHLDGFLGKPLEHGAVPVAGVPKLSGLAGDWGCRWIRGISLCLTGESPGWRNNVTGETFGHLRQK